MLYEDQAARFDERAGVPPAAADAAARALYALAGLREGDALLEVGAGTGSLSLPLLRLPLRYVGFDRSPAMLDEFRRRVADSGSTAELHVADGDERWPVDDGSVAAVFGARALHHLSADHVVAETMRVLRAPGGVLALGRVRRPPDSVKSTLRRRMRRTLEEQGFHGRNHEAGAEAVFTALEQRGGVRIPPVTAARWTHTHRPADSLASWAGKTGLAGMEVPADVKARVLAEVRAWALAHYGDLDAPLPQDEAFEIAAIRVPVA
ncbi:MAG: Methyltransferase type 11 [Gemmatimonadetes bacterium]|nr:Methyltransferase type 11 [Gemmatimonadota bacterium]